MIPHSIADAIADLIRAKRSEDHLSDLDRLLLSNESLPLCHDIGGSMGIRADGTFVLLDGETHEWSAVEPAWQLSALVSGAEKYPLLEALLPRRTTEADCEVCGGSGSLFAGLVKCGHCLGLGWNSGLSIADT